MQRLSNAGPADLSIDENFLHSSALRLKYRELHYSEQRINDGLWYAWTGMDEYKDWLIELIKFTDLESTYCEHRYKFYDLKVYECGGRLDYLYSLRNEPKGQSVACHELLYFAKEISYGALPRVVSE